MKEKLQEQEAKVVELCFNALDHLVKKLEEEKTINKHSEVSDLEKAVQLCHKIRSLVSPLA